MPSSSRIPPPGVTRGTPSAEERLARCLNMIVVLGFPGIPLLLLLIAGPSLPLSWLLGPSMLLGVVSVVWTVSIDGRHRRALRRVNYRVCLHCRYSLIDLAESGACPECGNSYTPDLLRQSWEWTYGELP